MQNNDISSLNKWYRTLDEVTNKYSFYSIAALIIKYNILVASLEIKVNLNKNESHRLLPQINKSIDLVKDHYNNTTRSQVSSVVTRRRDPGVKIINGIKQYVFDKDYYLRKYHSDANRVQQSIYKVNQEISDRISSFNFYIYAINKHYEPIIFNEVIPIREIIEGRKYLLFDGVPICHPMLLHNYDLTAIGAGEIIFIKDSRNTIQGAVVNNKSGHFKPESNSLLSVKESLVTALGIKEENIALIGVEGV